MKYDHAIAQAICDQISTTTVSLSKACEKHGIYKRDVYAWKIINPEFDQMYLSARRRQIEILIDEITDIIDEFKKLARGTEKNNSSYATAMKLELETKKWLAQSLLPKIYGSKANGTQDLGPIQAQDELDAIQAARDAYRITAKKEY